MSPHKVSRSFLLAFLLATAVAGVLAWAASWIGDDGMYLMDYSTGRTLQSFGDIWRSQVAHYHNTNGRFLVHYLLQVMMFLQTPHWLYGLLSGLIVACMFLAVNRLGGGLWRSPARFLLTAMAGWCLLTPGMQPTLVFNYFLPGLLCLVAAGLLLHGWKSAPKWAWPLVGLLAFCAGESHEGFSMPFAVAMLVFAVTRRFRGLSPVQWVVGLGFAAGACIAVFAPANFVRASTFDSISSPLSITQIWAGWIMLLVMVVQIAFRRTTLRRVWLRNWFWFVVMGVCILFSLKLDIYWRRQLFPAELAAIVVTLRLIPTVRISGWIVGIAAALFLPAAALITYNWWATSKAVEDISAKFKASGSTLIFYDLPQTPGFFTAQGLTAPCGNEHNLYAMHCMWTDYRDYFPILVLPTAYRERYESTQPLQTGATEWAPKKILFVRAAGDPPVQFDLAYDIELFGVKLITCHKSFPLTRSDYGPYKGDFSAVRLDYPFVKNIRVSWRYLSPGNDTNL